jgi:hypothetical protein
MTAACSSRWAGAITRTSNNQWERGFKNLLDTRVGLQRAARKLRARLAVPPGERRGRTRGTRVGGAVREAAPPPARAGEVGRGRGAHLDWSGVGVPWGRRLAKLRHALDRDDAALTVAEWRAWWEAERLFLTADGEADKPWGNETVRVHPDGAGWRSGCRPRLPTCRTRRVGHPPTGCPARWPSPTVGSSGRRRPPAVPSGTTSAWTRPRAAARARAAGILTLPGGSGRVQCRRWTNSASIAASGSTSTPTTSLPGSSPPPAIHSASPTRSRSTSTGSPPAPATAGSAPRSPSWFGSPKRTAAAR